MTMTEAPAIDRPMILPIRYPDVEEVARFIQSPHGQHTNDPALFLNTNQARGEVWEDMHGKVVQKVAMGIFDDASSADMAEYRATITLQPGAGLQFSQSMSQQANTLKNVLEGYGYDAQSLDVNDEDFMGISLRLNKLQGTLTFEKDENSIPVINLHSRVSRNKDAIVAVMTQYRDALDIVVHALENTKDSQFAGKFENKFMDKHPEEIAEETRDAIVSVAVLVVNGRFTETQPEELDRAIRIVANELNFLQQYSKDGTNDFLNVRSKQIVELDQVVKARLATVVKDKLTEGELSRDEILKIALPIVLNPEYLYRMLQTEKVFRELEKKEDYIRIEEFVPSLVSVNTESRKQMVTLLETLSKVYSIFTDKEKMDSISSDDLGDLYVIIRHEQNMRDGSDREASRRQGIMALTVEWCNMHLKYGQVTEEMRPEIQRMRDILNQKELNTLLTVIRGLPKYKSLRLDDFNNP